MRKKVIFVVDDGGTNQILDARRHPIYVKENVAPLGEVWTRVDGARISQFAMCTDPKRFSRKP